MVDFHGLLHQSGENVDISIFIKEFKENLLGIFGENLLFLGLQGSYGRGEAKETSDIDPVIILQRCGRDELLRYRNYIDTLPEKDIICGFVSSIEELKAWEGADRAQLILDTKPICNDLAELCPQITQNDIHKAVQQGACAVYHATSHNILHAHDWTILPELYKSSRFTIRMKHYLRTGVYIPAFKDLIAVVSEDEKKILENMCPNSEDDAFILLGWASDSLKEICNM